MAWQGTWRGRRRGRAPGLDRSLDQRWAGFRNRAARLERANRCLRVLRFALIHRLPGQYLRSVSLRYPKRASGHLSPPLIRSWENFFGLLASSLEHQCLSDEQHGAYRGGRSGARRLGNAIASLFRSRKPPPRSGKGCDYGAAGRKSETQVSGCCPKPERRNIVRLGGGLWKAAR